MQRFRLRLIVVLCLLLVASGVAGAQEDDLLDFDPSAFDETSAVIDNPWWSLTPGKQMIYEGFTTGDEGERIEHTIVFTVTDLIKEINGVATVVLYEQDLSEDVLEESELAFFAQDTAGNVWHFGQYTEIHDEEGLVGGMIWLVGHVEGAHAGIMMPADPQLGTASYSQGFAPEPFNWNDRARVVSLDEETCVPVGCYQEVLVTEEFNEKEPGAIQLKYYARGVGNIRVGWAGDDEQQEEMELVEIIQLGGEALAEAREAALELERRGYVYGTTEPAQVR